MEVKKAVFTLFEGGGKPDVALLKHLLHSRLPAGPHRQDHLEGGSFQGFGMNLDFAAVFLDDFLRKQETQAGSPGPFGAEENSK